MSKCGLTHTKIIKSTDQVTVLKGIYKNKEVVVKLFTQEEAFLHEASILKLTSIMQTDTPHLLSLIDTGSCEKKSYVLLPKLEGMTFQEVLKLTPKGFLDFSFADIRIAIQIAQALSVCEKYQLRHNDLHLGNIMLTPTPTQQLTTYHYPFEFQLLSPIKVTIFDYDFATKEDDPYPPVDERARCHKYGICDTFVPKWDWFYFFAVMRTWQSRLHFSIDFQALIPKRNSKRVLDRYPCLCLVGTPDACDKCQVDDEALAAFPSPTDFIQSCLQNDKFTSFLK
jgi:serine/threonine protein kinase